MKKGIALLLTVLLVMSALAGCGDSGNKIEPLPGDQETTEATEATESDRNGARVSLGRMENGTYINDYAGYACKLDENWQCATAEELQQLPENVQDILSGTEIAENAGLPDSIYDVQAQNAAEGTLFNVLYKKLDNATRQAIQGMSDEDMVDSGLTQKDQMIEAYKAAQMEVSAIEKVKVTFLGKECAALKTTSTMQGVPYYTLQIMNYYLGDYFVTLTLGSFGEDKTEELLEMFYAV